MRTFFATFLGRGRSASIAALVGILALLSLGGYWVTSEVLSSPPKIRSESARMAPTLPIADLHLHAETLVSAQEAGAHMARNRVLWGGGGARSAGRQLWLEYARVLGSRYIAFAGQSELNAIYREGGAAAAASATVPAFQVMLRNAEEDLKAGRVKGIGEVFVKKGLLREIPADAPSMRRLFDLVARYDAFLAIHMELDTFGVDQIEELKRLLAGNRRGRVLWYHCGSNADAAHVRSLMAYRPNLYCELSHRYPPESRSTLGFSAMFDSTGPDPDWLALIEDYPDRFMIGVEAEDGDRYDESIRMVRHNLLPYLRPATARKVAYANAVKLFGLEAPPDPSGLNAGL